MTNDFFKLMKAELLVTLILFIILFLKIGNKKWKNGSLLPVINFLLLVNVLAGFFFNKEGALFGDSFHTSPLITLEKNMLSLGTLIISLQANHWLRQHRHVREFYMLLLFHFMGMFFVFFSNNSLLFLLLLDPSTI